MIVRRSLATAVALAVFVPSSLAVAQACSNDMQERVRGGEGASRSTESAVRKSGRANRSWWRSTGTAR